MMKLTIEKDVWVKEQKNKLRFKTIARLTKTN